jgi:hypothetical protein
MNNLTKICKSCKIEKQRQGDFSGRSAVCCKCMYAKKKDYFQLYYKNNGEKMKVYEKIKYDKEHKTGLIRSYKKQQPENKIILV